MPCAAGWSGLEPAHPAGPDMRRAAGVAAAIRPKAKASGAAGGFGFSRASARAAAHFLDRIAWRSFCEECRPKLCAGSKAHPAPALERPGKTAAAAYTAKPDRTYSAGEAASRKRMAATSSCAMASASTSWRKTLPGFMVKVVPHSSWFSYFGTIWI